MSTAWKFSYACPRAKAQEAQIIGFETLVWHDEPVLVASEDPEAGTGDDGWRLDAYFDGEPDEHDLRNLQRLAGGDDSWESAAVDDEDWVTLSQAGLEPVTAGRFVIQTGEDAGFSAASGQFPLTIPASMAFGTGHHETTSGCLEMLTMLHREGRQFRSVMDIGTGTGLLAIAAQKLWRVARLTASDLDPNCTQVVAENCERNDVNLGRGPGKIAFCVADGTNSPLIRRRQPFDLILANILAGPLSAMAPSIGAIARPGAMLVLAGMIESQVGEVTGAYLSAGFAPVKQLQRGDWTILLLRKRATYGYKRRERVRAHKPTGFGYGEW